MFNNDFPGFFGQVCCFVDIQNMM